MLDAALRVSLVTLVEVIAAMMTSAGVTSSVGQPTVKIIIQGPQPICKLRSSGLLKLEKYTVYLQKYKTDHFSGIVAHHQTG